MTIDTLLELRRKELALLAELETLIEQLRAAREDVDLRRISKINDDRRDLRRRLALVMRALPGISYLDPDRPFDEAPPEARELVEALDRVIGPELRAKALMAEAEKLKPAADKVLAALRLTPANVPAPAVAPAPAAKPESAPPPPAPEPAQPVNPPTPPKESEAAAAQPATSPPSGPGEPKPEDPPTEPAGRNVKLEPPPPPEPVSTPTAYPPLGLGRAVLVVDDDMVCRAVCRKFFGRFSFQIYETGSLAQAAKALDIRKVDLVLLDEHLPDGQGTALLDKISGMPGVRVILMTGDTDAAKLKTMQEELQQEGQLDGFWVKPLNPERIMRVATRLVAIEEDPEAPRRPDGRALLDWQS